MRKQASRLTPVIVPASRSTTRVYQNRCDVDAALDAGDQLRLGRLGRTAITTFAATGCGHLLAGDVRVPGRLTRGSSAARGGQVGDRAADHAAGRAAARAAWRCPRSRTGTAARRRRVASSATATSGEPTGSPAAARPGRHRPRPGRRQNPKAPQEAPAARRPPAGPSTTSYSPVRHRDPAAASDRPASVRVRCRLGVESMPTERRRSIQCEVPSSIATVRLTRCASVATACARPRRC